VNPCASAEVFLVYRRKSRSKINQKMCLKVDALPIGGKEKQHAALQTSY